MEFQTINSQNIVDGHAFQELQNSVEDVLREVKCLQESVNNKWEDDNKTKINT